MPTTVTSKIGATNSPTVMDYSTLAAWIAACPANLVAADQIWDGQCYDQGKFTGGVTISGITTDATRYVVLECASGASFGTKAGVRSTALFYDSTTGSGVAFDMSAGTGITLSADYTRVDGLQVKQTGYSICINANAASTRVSNCIVYRSAAVSPINDNHTTSVWANCLLIGNGSSGDGYTGDGQLRDCTLVNVGSAGTTKAINSQYNQAFAQNCAFFGFSGNLNGSSTLNSSSDYNATDLAAIATAGGGGTHNVFNLTFASQFVSTSSDFRAVFGSGLHAGTPDATYAPLDISLFTRSLTTPYIGCWEASGAATSFSISPSTIPESHVGNISLVVTGTGTNFVSGSTVSVTNSLTGTTTVTKVSWSASTTTSATLTVSVGSGTGTYKVTVDGTDQTGTLTVATPVFSVLPTSGTVSGTTNIALSETNALWNADNPTFTYTSGPAGTSIGSIVITSNTTATAVMTCGGVTGAGTITDPSTGKTCTFTVAAVSGSITITRPVAFQGYWRNTGDGLGDIVITGTYTGGPGTLTVEADFNGGGYATIATAAGGTFSGTLSDQAPGNGTLTVRFVNATSINASVANVTIGAVLVVAGQSNAAGELTNLQSYSNGSGLKAVAFAAGNTSYTAPSFWKNGNDPFGDNVTWTQGSPWPLLATHLMNDLGYPVVFVETAIGGRSLVASNWFWTKRRPDTGAAPAGYAEITTSITNAATGGVDAVLWYQGENDVDGSITRNVYAQALGTFADQVAADFANTPRLACVQIGYDGQGGVSTSVADGIKLAITDGVNGGGGILNGMVSIYDFSNQLHILSDAEGQKCADRMYAVLKSEVFGGTAGAGRGPRVVACQYNAARTAVTVCFDKVLKTGLTFSTTAWTVSGVSVTGVAYHSTNTRAVVLTLSGAASLPITVSLGLGSPAGLTVPLGPDFTLPGGAGTINLPAEMFKDAPAAAAEVTGGGSSGGAPVVGSALVGGKR